MFDKIVCTLAEKKFLELLLPVEKEFDSDASVARMAGLRRLWRLGVARNFPKQPSHRLPQLMAKLIKVWFL